MIAIVSSSPTERVAFADLCDSQGWSYIGFDSVRSTTRQIHRIPLRVLLLRHRLFDGYSDDVMAAMNTGNAPAVTKVIVLVGANTSPAIQARQLSLGADCVQRDPVRNEVLLAYLIKYFHAPKPPRNFGIGKDANAVAFAGAILHTADRSLTLRGKRTVLTAREVELVEALHQSAGHVVRYEALYSEILGRKFCGDTSNMRVLLGKLTASTRSLGIELRKWVEVIPKSGYRYWPASR